MLSDQNPPQQQRIKRIGMIHPQSSPRPKPHPPLLPLLFPHPPQQNRRIRIHNQELLPPHVSTPHPQSLLQQPVAAKSLIIEPPNLFLLMLYIMQQPGCVTLNLKKFFLSLFFYLPDETRMAIMNIEFEEKEFCIMDLFGKKMVDIVHELMKRYVMEGDFVVDATAGNGLDTAYLCRLVGDSGRVYAFDIQEAAIDHTRKRLEAEGLEDRATLCLCSHDRMCQVLESDQIKQIGAFCFNLGYLPDGDPSIITNTDTTCRALLAALELLKPGGVGTVLSYYGHCGGPEEKENVDKLLHELPARKYEVMKVENHNRRREPPILYMIQRLR